MHILSHIILRTRILCIYHICILDFSIFLCFYYNLNLYVIIHLIYFLHMYANLRNRCKPHPLYSFLPFSFNLFKTLFFFFFLYKIYYSILLLPTLVYYQKERKKYLYTYLNLVVQRYIYTNTTT